MATLGNEERPVWCSQLLDSAGSPALPGVLGGMESLDGTSSNGIISGSGTFHWNEKEGAVLATRSFPRFLTKFPLF